ncbi:MAG: sodium:solute symporter family protein [Synergistaceae bacterium]|nr:sodium:solute symporter family protein [Synergistaceae bacterium]
MYTAQYYTFYVAGFVVLIFIFVYAIILVSLGAFIGRKAKSASDFFVAGRKFGTGLLFTSLIAANLGAGSTVGVTALAYTHGVSAWWWIGSAGIGSLILAYIVGPKIWRIAREHNYFTLSDYLDERYSKTFSGIISLMMSVGTLALFAGQLLGIAWILEVVAEIPKTQGVIIGAVVTTLYFAAGGLLSSAVVNIVEVAVILAGFVVAVPFVWNYAGGAEGIQSAVSKDSYFDAFGMGSGAIIGYIVMLVPSFFISPGLIGKVFAAESERAVKNGTALNGLVQLIFAVIPVIIGMSAGACIPNLARADLALPSAMKEMMPFFAASLALAGIFAAEVSTADTVLYMLAGSLVNDIYKRFINPSVSDKKLLTLSRVVTVVCGIAGVILALRLESIISALTIFYSLMSVSLSAPLLFGLFTERAGNAGAVMSALIGAGLTVYMTFEGVTFDVMGVKLNASTCGIIVSFAVMAMSLIVSKKSSGSGL